MANVILFTDRTPHTQEIQGELYQFERYTRGAGAYKIASNLRNHGFSVVVIPNCLRLSFATIKEIISANSKDLLWVGISTTFMTVRSSSIENYRKIWATTTDRFVNLITLTDNYNLRTLNNQIAWATTELNLISDFVKSEFSAEVVLGGTWVSHIKDGALDLNITRVRVVTGMAEDYSIEMTQALHKKLPVPFQLATKEGQKYFKSSFIDYTEHDHVNPDDWLSIEISRGCAFKCAYCTYDHKGKSDTTKWTKTLRDELIRNYEHWGVTKYHLLDDLYNDSEYKIKTLYDEVWSQLPFQPEWISYLRLDLIWSNPDSAEWIKQSGCKLGCFGIETLHDRAGRGVGKGLGKERILETLKFLKEKWGSDVLIDAMMIAGLPYEPYEHIVETMEWIRTTDLVNSYSYQPLWVTPPDHKKIVLQYSDMSKDYDKYQLTWGPDGWVNNVDVSFKMVSELCMNLQNQRYDNYFPVDFQEYTELRTLGYSHADLARREFKNTILNNITSHNYPINDLITARLEKILKIKD